MDWRIPNRTHDERTVWYKRNKWGRERTKEREWMNGGTVAKQLWREPKIWQPYSLQFCIKKKTSGLYMWILGNVIKFTVHMRVLRDDDANNVYFCLSYERPWSCWHCYNSAFICQWKTKCILLLGTFFFSRSTGRICV